jgi:pimeloyl-ACP methyl ester carboxylesterase
MWKNQLVEFGKDFLAVAPDMRGYNLSSRPQEVSQYKARILMEDVRQLAQHLGHEKFTLVAHDWGGAVAWTFAMFYSQFVRRLIIINAPHPATFERELRNNPEQRKASSYMLMFRAPQAEATLIANNYEWLRKLAFGDLIKKGIMKKEDLDEYINAWSQPGALTGGLNYYRAASVEALENPEEAAKKPAAGELLPKILVPTLVIWGEKDTALLTGCIDGLDKYIPDLRIKRIPDASHWVVEERSDLVNQYMRDFIKET